jgi:hypothetical protein
MDELISILLNHTAEHRELVASKASRFCQFNRLQPVFRILLRPLNVNVPGLVAFPTRKRRT